MSVAVLRVAREVLDLHGRSAPRRAACGERVTHLNGAPTVLVTIAEASQAHQLDRPLKFTVAGAPPPLVRARPAVD